MNIQYYDICEKILGQRTEDNKYEFQLLYLVCYLDNKDSVEKIPYIKQVIKRLYSKIKKNEDLLHDILFVENRKKWYTDDFYVYGMIYYNEISYNEANEKVDSQLGLKAHRKNLMRLYIICCFYNTLIGARKNVVEKEETYCGGRNSITEKDFKKDRTGKTGGSLESKIREGVYSRIRNRIIRIRRKNESI